jgi:hypothetical protein
MKLGIIARCDNTGLGNQTFELVKMLNPQKIMLIDSSSFHTGHQQHFEWYQGKNYSVIKGVPDKNQIVKFIQGLDVVLSCETFYSKHFVQIAKYKKVKTVLQYNFEFLQYLQTQEKFLPDMLLGPTVWNIDVIKEKFENECKVEFLPPPTDPSLFQQNKETNLQNTNRLLHIGGKAAAHDRNGTKIILEMMKYAKSNFELVVRSQTPIDFELHNDERIEVLISNKKNREELYSGFDAMVLPRRYGGLCLPMNEALLSGIPTFMPDISPNNYFLSKEWLIKSKVSGEFMTKTKIDLNETDPRTLAFAIDNYFSIKDKTSTKKQAYEIGYNNFSPDVLKDKYLNTLKSLLT